MAGAEGGVSLAEPAATVASVAQAAASVALVCASAAPTGLVLAVSTAAAVVPPMEGGFGGFASPLAEVFGALTFLQKIGVSIY